MTWYVAIENYVAIEETLENTTEEDIKEEAALKFIEWLQKGEIDWRIERE